MKPFGNLENIPPRGANIRDATLRDFSGGLVDNNSDAVMPSKFSTDRVNFLISDDVSLRLRFGTKLFSTVGASIVDGRYFGTRFIVVCTNGEVYSVNENGDVVVIWNAAIAAALPGSPTAWDATTHVDFTEMSGELIIHNNENKPLIVDSDYQVTYLNDPATGSNVNTPIAKHCTTVGDFCVFALEDDPELFISSSGTAKVWPGDGAPNNSTRFNLGSYVSSQSKKIIGIVGHNNLLHVFLATTIVIIKLGTYDSDGVHRPEVIDVISEAGVISHRTALSHPDGLLCFCTDGVYLITTNVFGKYDRKKVLESFSREYLRNIPTNDEQAEKAYIVHDSLQATIFFFCVNNAGGRYMLAYNYKRKLLDGCWTEIAGWNFTAGASSAQKRLFFFEGSKCFLYGNLANEGEEFHADYINDADYETPETIGEGVEIAFVLESPWMDANLRLRTKQIQYITGESVGNALFTLDIYVDKFYKRINGNLDPAGRLMLTAGSLGGYGLPSEGFGGGRRLSDERYHRMPIRCKIFKYRLHGSTKQEFILASLSFIYQLAGYTR